MIVIYLDSDESQVVQIDNIDQVDSLDELMQLCKKKFKLGSIDISEYGFIAKQQ
jgi:hypothetical protein